jgi:hypothetical protein
VAVLRGFCLAGASKRKLNKGNKAQNVWHQHSLLGLSNAIQDQNQDILSIYLAI